MPIIKILNTFYRIISFWKCSKCRISSGSVTQHVEPYIQWQSVVTTNTTKSAVEDILLTQLLVQSL